MERKSIVLYGLAIGAVLMNLCNLNIFFGVDFVFGSIFALIIVVLFGLKAGLAAGLIASCFTVVHWEHFYAIPVFTLEILIVGILMKRSRKMPLIVANIIFWLIIGLPASYISYRYGLKMPSNMVSLIVFKQALNGVFNASVAGMIIFAIQAFYDGKPVFNLPKPCIRHIVFTLFTFGLLAGCLAVVGIESRRDEYIRTKDVSENLNLYSVQIKNYLVAWHNESIESVSDVVKKINSSINEQPSLWLDEKGYLKAAYLNPQIQLLTESCRRGRLGFDAAYVANADGITVAFYPIISSKGQSTIGLDYSDRNYYKQLKETMRPVISEVLAAKNSKNMEPVITVSVPIEHNGKFIGFVTAGYKIATIAAQLKLYQSDTNYSLNILDGNDNLVLSSMQSADAAAVYTKGGFDYKDVLSGSIKHFTPQGGSSTLAKYKDSWFIKNEKIGFSGWKIIVGYPASVIQDKLADFVSTGLMIIYFVFLMGCPAALLFSNLITRPLAALTNIKDTLKLLETTKDINSVNWPDSFIEEVSLLSAELKSVLGDYLSRFKNNGENEKR